MKTKPKPQEGGPFQDPTKTKTIGGSSSSSSNHKPQPQPAAAPTPPRAPTSSPPPPPPLPSSTPPARPHRTRAAPSPPPRTGRGGDLLLPPLCRPVRPPQRGCPSPSLLRPETLARRHGDRGRDLSSPTTTGASRTSTSLLPSDLVPLLLLLWSLTRRSCCGFSCCQGAPRRLPPLLS